MPEKKARKKQEQVVTEYRPISQGDWGHICSQKWTPATRILIGHLFAGDGKAYAAYACEGTWSRVMQANRLFIKFGLQFRIREEELTAEELEKQLDGEIPTFHIQKLWVYLHTVTHFKS